MPTPHNSLEYQNPVMPAPEKLAGSQLQDLNPRQARRASHKEVLRYDYLGELKSIGACNGLDTNIFFPDENNDLIVASAKKICAQCVVREECLEYALAANEQFGIWGGETASDRRRIRRQRARASRQLAAAAISNAS